MAKVNKKSAKKASEIFHNIMKSSVKGNPKPEKSKSKG
jgi:Txe/YoeB family toxin of Txe-Axe toxin-antitoxin module